MLSSRVHKPNQGPSATAQRLSEGVLLKRSPLVLRRQHYFALLGSQRLWEVARPFFPASTSSTENLQAKRSGPSSEEDSPSWSRQHEHSTPNTILKSLLWKRRRTSVFKATPSALHFRVFLWKANGCIFYFHLSNCWRGNLHRSVILGAGDGESVFLCWDASVLILSLYRMNSYDQYIRFQLGSDTTWYVIRWLCFSCLVMLASVFSPKMIRLNLKCLLFISGFWGPRIPYAGDKPD